MTVELTQKVESALNGLETFKTELLAKAAKFDAFDQTKFDKIQKEIGEAIEASQQAKAAADAKAKVIEDDVAAIKTAMNRAGAAAAPADEKALAKKANKLFNQFARIDDENKKYFDSFVKTAAKDDPEIKSLSVNSDPNGGYLVMPEFGGIVNTYVYETSPMRQVASVVTIGSDTYEVITDNDQVSASWVGETQARPATGTPTLGKIVIAVNELEANPQATQKILDDSMIDMEGWLAGKVSALFGRKEATAFISGTGVLQPKGILSYAAGTDITQQQIQQVNSGSSGAFTYIGLVNLQNALKEDYQANALFMIQRASNASIMTLVDGQSRPIFNMTYDKNVGLEPTILGRQVRFASDIPGVGVNALAAIYGDFKSAYQIVDRAGIRVLRDPFTNKPYIGFYTTKRVGGAVVNFEAAKIQKLA